MLGSESMAAVSPSPCEALGCGAAAVGEILTSTICAAAATGDAAGRGEELGGAAAASPPAI